MLCGLSAGSLCWFDHALTGYQNEVKLVPGLGILPYGNSVHFKPGSEQHHEFESRLDQVSYAGYAATDGAALHFVGTELAQVVASRPEARAYRIDRRGDRARTTQIATRHLGSPTHVPLVDPTSYAWSMPSELSV